MTQKEFDALMIALREGQRIAAKSDNEIIDSCNIKLQEIYLKIDELRVKASRLKVQRKEAIDRRTKIYNDFHAQKSELCMKYPKSAMEPDGTTKE